MFSPLSCEFGRVITNGFSTAVTPGINDAMGNWAECIPDATLTEDCYGIHVLIGSTAVAGQARPLLMDIGADPAGGTNYGVIIPYLNAACTPSFSAGFAGFSYYFPLFIKAGSAVAARAQVGNGTAGGVSVIIRLYTKPKRPDLLRCGSYVDAIGIDAANSRGAAITPGVSAVEGAWASLGTLLRPGWWIQTSFSIDDDTMQQQNLFMDVATGDATNKKILTTDQPFTATASEQLAGMPLPPGEAFADLPSGAELFARILTTIATADSNNTAMAYVLGG